jgi:NhaA family Na+:H+ antiporter
MRNVDALPTPHAPALHAQTRARTWRGLPDLWHFAAEYLLLLPLGAAIGLVWANVYPESYFRTVFALDFFVNDIAMVLFFGLLTKEVVEATAPGGILHPWRRAALPLTGALGMTLLPALLLWATASYFGEPMVRQGWSVTFATDLAVMYFAALVIFGRHPVIPFLLLLGLSADVLGFIALAPAAAATQLQFLTLAVLMAAAIGSAMILRSRATTRVWPYMATAGVLSWSALLLGGVHPALALVPVIPFLPHAARDPGFFVDAPAEARDTLNAFERWCRHPAQVALLLFAFISAGVPLRALDLGTLAMPLAVFVGKPLGLLAGLAAGLAAGLHLPYHVTWRHLVVVAFLSTIGFTMALFFATVAIAPGAVLSEVKMGSMLTLFGLVPAFVLARLLRVGRFAATRGRSAVRPAASTC